MSASSNTVSIARQPLQSRGRERFEQVLSAARALLVEEGLAGFSIPALANRLGFTRASIYNFFPTPHAVLNELARGELHALEHQLIDRSLGGEAASWQRRVRHSVDEVVRFYGQRPVARLLLLGEGVTDEIFRAQSLSIHHLGELAQRLFERDGLYLPREPVDVVTLSIELATTCLRHSVYLHGQITPAYADEAARVMVDYLRPHVEALVQAPGKLDTSHAINKMT